MRMPPREPNPGDKLSASWMRELVRYIRAITPLPGKGAKFDYTPNGTRISCQGGGTSSGGGGTDNGDNGCFKIVVDDSSGDPVKTFDNCYYAIGGKIYDLGACGFSILEDAVHPDEDVPASKEYCSLDAPYVCLKVWMKDTDDGDIPGDAEIVAFNKWDSDDTSVPGATSADESVVESSSNDAYYLKPLYKFAHDGSVVIDYRNMPVLSAMEL